jgi:hypothetical protein
MQGDAISTADAQVPAEVRDDPISRDEFADGDAP